MEFPTGSPMFDLASMLLGYYRDALAELGVPAFERVYVSDGNIAWPDCPGLIVDHTESRPIVEPGQNEQPLREGTAVHDYLTVLALRDSAGPRDDPAPDDDVVTAAAAVVLRDRWALRVATYGLITSPSSPLSTCEWLQLVTIRGVGPEGGMVGSQVDLVVRL